MPRKTIRNLITSPELLAQINPENQQLVDDFLSYLRSIQRSETTIAGYLNDINIAMVWNLQCNGNKPLLTGQREMWWLIRIGCLMIIRILRQE